MNSIFGIIYSWFESLFGQSLAEYLWGYNCATQIYDGNNLFNAIGLITLLITLLLVIAYYYLPFKFFNHPRSNRWWNWLIILFVAGLINAVIASSWILSDLFSGAIGDCLMFTRDADGNIVSQLIFAADGFLFGVSNFIVSSLFFIIISFMIKWWSRNCKHSPAF